jgi:hypothetical protein
VSYDRGNFRDKWRIERQAAQVRVELGVSQFDVLDPERLVNHVGADVLALGDLVFDEQQLARVRAIAFDGATLVDPAGDRALILLNCGRPPRRRTATLMEELAHLLLRHRPSRIERDARLGIWRRSFDRAQEYEAYDLGAALLLPKERIQRDVKERECLLGEIAQEHGCSNELVAYRVRRMRLWDRYQSYAQLQPS